MKRIVLNVKSSGYKPVDISARWAVANETLLVNWWLDPAYSSWNNMPMTNKQCDSGDTNSRGRNLPVSNSLWDFIHQLNDVAGIKFIESVGRQIINRPWIDRYGKYRGPDTSTATDDPNNADLFANAEPVIYQPNPYKIIGETATHYQIDAYYRGMDFSTLDPKSHNWVTEPWKIVKCSAENRQGHVQNMMNGIDAFWISLCHRGGAWIPKSELVLAPDPTKYTINGKRGVGYRLVGSHWIMGLEDGSQEFVRRVTKAEGVKEYHGWHINARSVIPPAWFK